MRKRLTTVMASRGRVYDPKRPTTPAAATVNRSAIFARPYATARYARYSLFRAARIDPSVIWKHVWEVVRATLSTTRTANSCAAAALLTRRITVDNTIPMTEERPPPAIRTCHMRARGRSTRAINRTSPLSRPRMPIDVANEERFTRDPVIPTADEVKRCAASAQNAKPKIEFEMLPANTQPPCSRTSSDSDLGPVETFGLIQGNSQPSMRPTNGGRDSEAIRISRNGLRANPVMILPDRRIACTGSHMRLKARSIRSRSFIRGEPFFQIRRLIPKTFYVYSTGVPKSINTVRKFRGAPVTLILNAGRPHPPPSELECPSDEPLRFAFE